ncbi:MAG TPA: HD domain-containing phosphohydrolase [Spirochaetota bacterium]|nr:HD domain-containing phosphohydrolase [Spirochaetota bacterium]
MAKENIKEHTDSQLLHLIMDYISRIAEESDLDKLLILLADMGRDLVYADKCTVWLLDKKTGTLWSKASHGLHRVVIPITSGIAGYIATEKQHVIINDPYNDKRFNKQVDKKTGYKTNSIIGHPIFDSLGNIIGVFQCVNKKTGRGFSQKDLERLLLASIYTGKQLESSFLQEEIEQTQKEIIFTLAETGEMRSKETGNHVKRVSEYSGVLAQGLNMSKNEVDVIKLASTMHDIGKIAIPDAILLKNGLLNDEERTVMQTHVNLGYDMLRHSEREMLKAAAIIAHQHHEKWDGTGYPNGIKGKDIHVYGRIVSLADVFDALSSDRCYKKAWPMAKVYRHLEDQKGCHFSPELVDIFFKRINDFLNIKKQFKDDFT